MDRYLEIIHHDRKKTRLTCNPNTGRVTLKLPETISTNDNHNAVALAYKTIDYQFPTQQTYRGVIDLFTRSVTMYNNNKQHSTIITLS